eukprot:m.63929 g.63929  ORF g.63929 m.63929 type:complete len:676 (+) comp11613_c0_seq1:136-2163(+)
MMQKLCVVLVGISFSLHEATGDKPAIVNRFHDSLWDHVFGTEPTKTAIAADSHLIAVNVVFDVNDLETLDDEALERCEQLAKNLPTDVDGVSEPARTTTWQDDDEIVSACKEKTEDEHCFVKLPFLGEKQVPGMCAHDFGGSSKLLCIPVEVLGATQACTNSGDKAGDHCSIGYDQVKFSGVCCHDASGSGALGCCTYRGTKFLSYFSSGGSRLKDSSFISAKLQVHRFTKPPEGNIVNWDQRDEDFDVFVRRHGGASLCLGYETKSKKIPFFAKGKNIGGRFDGIVFSTGASDPSLLRSAGAGDIYRRSGVPVGSLQHVRVFYNGEYIGLYLASHQLSVHNIQSKLYPGSIVHSGAASLLESYQNRKTPTHEYLAEVVQGGWEPVDNADGKQIAVKEGDVVWVMNSTFESWWYVETTTKQRGWVPNFRLNKIDCPKLPGALLEPQTKLDSKSYLPGEFYPVDGVEPVPLWKDLDYLFQVLHSEERTTSPKTWRKKLENVFDVDIFLRALAASMATGNWDTYGSIPHNFRLYRPACSGRITWIPYDFDGAWTTPPDNERSNFTLQSWLNDAHMQWPLISFLLADTEYFAQYMENVHFTLALMKVPNLLTKLYDLKEKIAKYMNPDSPEGEDEEVSKIDWEAVKDSTDHLFKAVDFRMAEVRKLHTTSTLPTKTEL